MPEPTILRVYDNWEQGIGHLRDDGSPSLYTSDKILGLRGELRPAPAATQIKMATEPGHHFQYFFEEPITAGQTPALDASSVGTGTNVAEITFTSHTTANKDNRILIIFAITDEDHPPRQVKYKDIDLTLVGSQNSSEGINVSLWYLVSPATGTGNIVVTYGDGTHDIVGIASTWYKVNLSSPFDGYQGIDTDNDAGPATLNVRSISGAISIAACGASNPTRAITDDDETELENETVGDLRGAVSYEAGAALVEMKWTIAVGACDWVILGASILGTTPAPNTLYAMRGKKDGSSSTVKVNKIELENLNFGIGSTTSYHDLTPLTICGQSVRYQGYWWFPMGDDQKARRLQTIGLLIEDSTAVISEGGTFSATDTTLTVDDGTQFTVNDYIKIEDEILYISLIDGHDLTVTRGEHNTTAATHANATAIYLFSVGNDTLDATATALGADHFANLNHQVISTLKHSGNDAGGARILKEDGDIGTEAHWGSAFQVGDKNERAAGVASLMGLSFVLNVEGLFSFNSTGRSGMVFEDFRTWRHVFDNISIKPWRQGLLLSHPTGLLYYTPGQLPINVGIDISPAEAAIAPPGPPALRGGRYHSTAPIGDFIPAIYQPDLNSTTVNVLIGYPMKNNPNSLVWQHLATTELQDTDHVLGCYVTVGSKPLSAEYVTPTLWYGNDDDLDYIVLNSRASPFRTREDIHVVTTSGDAYLPEMFFPVPHKITQIVIYTQDMISGDEWEISAIVNVSNNIKTAPVKTSQRAPRPLNIKDVYRLMLHVNWKATSTAERVPPTIKKIEVWGIPEI